MKPTWTGEGVELHEGDCLSVLGELPESCADAVIADPPYGTTACKWDSVIPLEPMWAGLKHVAKERAAIVMTASQPFTTTLIASNMKMFKYCWVWEKQKPTNFYQVKRQPLKAHEDVAVFCRTSPNYFPQGVVAVNVKNGRKQKSSNIYSPYDGGGYIQTVGNYPSSIQFVPTEGDKDRVHPTQKPVALMAYLIRTYTNEGETVLDFTCGSGTTGVAAIREGRRFIGVEKDPKYFDIAVERIERELREQRIQPKLFT